MKIKKKRKSFSEEKEQDTSPSRLSPEKKMNNNEGHEKQIEELLYQLENQKFQIEDLNSTITKIEKQNQSVSKLLFYLFYSLYL